MKSLFLIVIICVAGCVRQTLPTYPLIDAESTYQAIIHQSQRICSIQSSAELILKSEAQSVSLDAAILIERPDKIRVRAWKLGQAVFDLTINPQGAWQYTPREEAREATHVTRDIVKRFIEVLLPSSPAGIVRIDGNQLVAEHEIENDATETRRYDRATRVLQWYQINDAKGVTRFELKLSDYRVIDQFTWPMKMVAISQQGTFEVRFGDVSFNQLLAPTAFKPPARAEPLP